MQGWCYPYCQRANFNTIPCDAEIMLLSNLSKSQNHPLRCRVGCQRANIIHCDAEIMLLPNLSKSQYHPLWCRDDAISKSAKEQIPSIVMQRWCYYQICQRANTIHCDSEMMLLPNLPKSKYHPLWFRDNAITKAAKEPISSIVMQRWLPKSQYHPLWCRDNPVTKSARANIIHSVWVVTWFLLGTLYGCSNTLYGQSDRM